MEDDFSIDLEPKNGNTVQVEQYSTEYADRLMKTVTESEESDGKMPWK